MQQAFLNHGVLLDKQQKFELARVIDYLRFT